MKLGPDFPFVTPRAYVNYIPPMLSPTQKAYIRKEESSPTVMWALPISSPPLYRTESTIRFPESPVCRTKKTQKSAGNQTEALTRHIFSFLHLTITARFFQNIMFLSENTNFIWKVLLYLKLKKYFQNIAILKEITSSTQKPRS